MTTLLSRKFILAVMTLLLTSLLCFLGNVSDGVYSAVIIATVGAYITGNVLQKNNKNNTNTSLNQNKETI